MEKTILNVLSVAEIAEFMEWQTTRLRKTGQEIEREIHCFSVVTTEEFVNLIHGLEFLNLDNGRFIVRVSEGV